MDDTKPIEDFPGYVVSKAGHVYTERNGMRLRPSTTQDGAYKVTMYQDGRPKTRSLALLVAKAWLYNDRDPEIFDTPIHLDNDLSNNHVDNLAWRPRWFAVKYQRQYWNEEFRYATTRIQDMSTGREYKGFIDPCQEFGLLYMDVIKSCTAGTDVFPTWKKFCFIG